jgi:transketolase
LAEIGTTEPEHIRSSGNAIRRVVLEQSHRANVGHIGSALSVADIIGAIYNGVLRVSDPRSNNRDRFVLSKGHAALALYGALYVHGQMSAAELDTFCCDGSRLGVHPDRCLDGIDFSTGSLGHGLSIGAGAALAARLQGSTRRVFVLMSDAELNEGSVWEAAMFAAHHRLSNLVPIVDLNGQQALGKTQDVLHIDDPAGPWRSFGWNTEVVDGHDEQRLVNTLSALDPTAAHPTAIIAKTVFGKGVSFMECQLRWHYLPMTDEEYERAVLEVDRR